jgi:hypothetical protein
MMDRDGDLPPLPTEIADGMRALRRERPKEALIERTFEKITEASVTHRSAKRPTSRRFRLPWFALVATPVLVTGAVLVGSSLLATRNHVATSAIERSEERAVDLPEDGHVWTDLHLQTHHHADWTADVDVEVPENVRVAVPGADGPDAERHCEASRCVHRFTHRHGHSPPLRVAVTHPGRYEIHVRHVSKEAHVRERFVLTAQREQEAPPRPSTKD